MNEAKGKEEFKVSLAGLSSCQGKCKMFTPVKGKTPLFSGGSRQIQLGISNTWLGVLQRQCLAGSLVIVCWTGFHHSQNLQSSVQLGGSQSGNHQEDSKHSRIPSSIDRGDTGCLLTSLPLLCIMNTVHMLSMCVEGRWYP